MEIVNNSDIAFRNERGITFMNYIEENYESLKRQLKRVHNGYKEVLFDEDVFQDTILKVNESLKGRLLSKEVYEKYFRQSFKRNLLREKLYHFNSKTDKVYDFEEIDVFENKFIELLSNIKFNVAQDQDYLNVICKGHVTFIDETWNEMPLPVEIERPAKPKLIHYNLSFKPWRLDDVLCEEVFWNYARKTSFIYDILETKRSYTKEMQENTERQTLKLIQLTKDQAEDTEENARVAELIKSILGE